MDNRLWAAGMRPHELNALKRSKMYFEVESNETIDEAIRWYNVTVEARSVDYMSGTIHKLTWNDVISLVNYEPTWLSTRDLAFYCFTIDSCYIDYIHKEREQSKK